MRPNNEEITKSYRSHILVFFGWDSLSDMCRLRCWSPARFVAYTIYISPTMFVAYDVSRRRCLSSTMSVAYDVCRLRCISPTMFVAYDVCRLRCLSPTMYSISPTMFVAYDVCALLCWSPWKFVSHLMIVASNVCFASMFVAAYEFDSSVRLRCLLTSEVCHCVIFISIAKHRKYKCLMAVDIRCSGSTYFFIPLFLFTFFRQRDARRGAPHQAHLFPASGPAPIPCLISVCDHSLTTIVLICISGAARLH